MKIKAGPDWRKLVQAVPSALDAWPELRLRVDFNGTLSADGLCAFAQALSPAAHAAVDFIEDPCPFEAKHWHALEQSTGLRLAADRACADAAAEDFIGVVKPSVEDAPALLARAVHSGRKMVVTSNMDHPLGILWAAYHAGLYARAGVLHGLCGLCTQLVFEPDAFSARLPVVDGRFCPPGGTGLGFDDLLAALPWEILREG